MATADRVPGVYWAQVLHFYQPPTQTHDVLARIVEESYRPLLTTVADFPSARLAVHINGVLTELLLDHGFGDIVGMLRELGERGQVEFLGGGRFHPILPLLDARERAQSIAENHAVNGTALGAAWSPRGFFPPELAYSPVILPEVAASGHEWVLVSGVAAPNHWPTADVARAAAGAGDVAVLFRDDARSNRIAFRQATAHDWVAELEAMVPGDGAAVYVVTALDAETFGHHIAGWEREFLAAAYGLLTEGPRATVHLAQPSDLLALFPAGARLEPRASSWSTSPADIDAANPFPLWHSPENPIHRLQWEYVEAVRSVLETARLHAEGQEALRLLRLAGETFQPALHSCQFWWASRRPWWEPIMAQRGLALLTQSILYAVRAVELSPAPGVVRREVEWKLAASDAIRGRLERLLFVEAHP